MRVLRVKVKPNSKQQEIREAADGSWTVRLKSPPIDGKANAELIQLLAQRFEVPKSAVRIKAGAAASNKLIEVDLD